MSSHERAPTTDALTVLAGGQVVPVGRMPWSSNATFLVNVDHDDGSSMRAVYKPVRGERPLWDFPGRLAAREVAAYRLSAALGWDLVPETIMREDGPFGPGSLQRFVDADFAQHYFTLLEDPVHHDALRAMAAFDLVANNADRKGGHCLIDEAGHLWGIDNGLCFHVEPRLRTVIWDFGHEPIPPLLTADLARLVTTGLTELDDLLAPEEVTAVLDRAAAVSRLACFPDPGEERRPYPWPLV